MMRRAGWVIGMAAVWAGATLGVASGSSICLAQDSDFDTADAQVTAPQPPDADLSTRKRDLDRQLADARERLEQAARQVAQLSAEFAADARSQALKVQQSWGRAVIGLQLDPASGKEGARVLEVSPGGPAAEAGVRPGDVITAVNGIPIAGHDTALKVVTRVQHLRPNAKVRLSVVRDGKPQDLQLTTRSAYVTAFDPFGGPGAVIVTPEAAESMPALPALPNLPDLRYLEVLSGETAGMELTTLTPALGWYFGTEKGVLVLRAADHDAFGLKDGDVILSIDGREPQNGTHATRILRSYQPGERITFKIMRQKRPVSLSVRLPQA